MAYSPITDLQLGKFLQIAFSEGIRSQISEDHKVFELVERAKIDDPNGRQLNFFLQTSLGPAAIQYRSAGGGGNFPTAQQSSTQECTAQYKDIEATIELEYNLWNRARMSPAKYGEPLLNEIKSKTIGYKRRIAADLFGDGTGVMGTVSSVADDTDADEVVVTLATTGRGHIGFFEYHDLLSPYQSGGSARVPSTSGTFYAWKVKKKNRRENKVTLQPVDASGAALTLTASNLVATDVFYRVGQPTKVNLSSISDYATCSEVFVGLESLSAADGRTVHGITMEGQTAGSVLDADGAAYDWDLLQEAMDMGKLNVGEGQYNYRMLVQAPEAQAALIASRETDRRFTSVKDNKRGLEKFAFVHGNDTLESYTTEFVPKNRQYCLPEATDGKKVIEFHMSNFEPVDPNGNQKMQLKPSSEGGHERKVAMYMSGVLTALSKHPAAIIRIDDAALS